MVRRLSFPPLASGLLGLALAWAWVGSSGCSCGTEVRPRRDGGESELDGGGRDGATDGALTDGARPDTNRDANLAPEICDGTDNDGNGIVDDVDEGMDGVCDCLRIATLGVAGNAGVGGVFAAWLDERSTLGAVDLGDAVLTAELLAPYQVILSQNISSGHARTPEEVAALEAWIRGGGGFMTLTGYADPSERTNVNLLLLPSGLQYGPEPILYGGGVTVPVDTWHPHPVSDMVSRLGIDNGYPVVGSGTVVSEEGGHVVLRATELGTGHVLAWGDEWISFDSEWVGHPDYQVERFWLNALKWLSPAGECQVPIVF